MHGAFLHITSWRDEMVRDPRQYAETFCAETGRKPETHGSETKTRQKRWAFCPRRDRDRDVSTSRDVQTETTSLSTSDNSNKIRNNDKTISDLFVVEVEGRFGKNSFCLVERHESIVVNVTFYELRLQLLQPTAKHYSLTRITLIEALFTKEHPKDNRCLYNLLPVLLVINWYLGPPTEI